MQKRQDDWWFNDVAEEVSGGESSVFRTRKKSIIRLGPHFYLPDEVIFYQGQKKIYTGD